MIGVLVPLRVMMAVRRRSRRTWRNGIRVRGLVGGPMQRWPLYVGGGGNAAAAIRIKAVQMNRIACIVSMLLCRASSAFVELSEYRVI